ncbi:hypothetical protein [Lichenifustis flavocetrariae]|uniref:Uncharacterized protein n=1 Tax=Lichenifustis flavocetrariae TaxID=2949735 RepID=A0AA42CMZ7_9HYPH|nr:hypothetical protein [Lichenifustis flavocetrariae]MCW6513023.1 hypothetical protein [Lichenifustis flavocetrariae]
MEWAEHKEKHDQLRDEARRELGLPEKEHEQEKAAPKKDGPSKDFLDRYDHEIIDMDEPKKEERDHPADVRSYVDDYIAGRGRGSAEHEQFAANYGADIEQEFQRRMAEKQEPSHDAPREQERSSHESEPLPEEYYKSHETEFSSREHDHHEPDYDREYGDD